jgi:glycosyltransferase involved in cell wall biosynthesis
MRTALFVVFAGDGDAWGLLGGEALAHGALVVAPAEVSFFEVLPEDATVIAATADDVAGAVADVRANPARYAQRGERARRESARRLPDIYAAQRIRELARAMAHGMPGALTLAITPDVAATLRR